MDWETEIFKLSSTELYSKAIALQFKDWDYYFIYMTMSANLNNDKAKKQLMHDYVNQITEKQNHKITIRFYEITKFKNFLL